MSLAEQLAKYKVDRDGDEESGPASVDVYAAGCEPGGGVEVVRIVHISDTHGKHWELLRSGAIPHGDVLVHSGDFMTAREKTVGEVEDVLLDMNRFFGELSHREVLFVAGNHEYCMFDYSDAREEGDTRGRKEKKEGGNAERERKRDKVKKLLSHSERKERKERKRAEKEAKKEEKREEKEELERARGVREESSAPPSSDTAAEKETQRRAQRARRRDRYKSKAEIQAALPNCRYLEDGEAVVAGVRFYGVPWNSSGMAYGLKTDERTAKWATVPGGRVDVLITHGPAFGILDKAWTNKDQYAAVQCDTETGKCKVCGERWHKRYGHWGCKVLRNEVARIAPRAVLFGHVHDSNGAQEVGDVLFVNSAMDLRPRAHVINYHLP
mmetsp:Transcript_1152/g.4122  ORF Transcript_1152/g.4122 Transcript_1152/m.4122 type:complete len:383 (-) Transcript_1152:42-1190(-)